MSALDGQVALVTGSSRGIGAAIAAELARQGAPVAVHGRDAGAAAAVAAQIAGDGGKAITVTGDVTEFDQVESVRREVEDGLGPVDILVANAGGSFTRPGSKSWGGTSNRARNSGGKRPGIPRTVSRMTQSVWPQSASVPSSSRPSVRRRAQTRRNPITCVESVMTSPSGSGARITSSAARTTQARFRSAYQARVKPSRSE